MAKTKGKKQDNMFRTCSFFITFTFPTRVTNVHTKLQLQRTLPYVQGLLEYIKFEGLAYVEATKVGLIHYHAVGTFEMPLKNKDTRVYLNNLAKKIDNTVFGVIDVEQTQYEQSSDEYIKKDRLRSLELFGRHCIWNGKTSMCEMEDVYELESPDD